MIGKTEKKMYKVLKNVGVKRDFITKAQKIDDLYLDDFDKVLLQYYFENEFHIILKPNEANDLINMNKLHHFLISKGIC
jgi:hypothetical protein